MAEKKYNQMATKIIEGLGGVENLANLNHCATRVRVIVKDETKVDKKALESIDGVFGTEVKGTNVQVIVGGIIESVFPQIEAQVGHIVQVDTEKVKRTPVEMFRDFLLLMAGIMSPLIPSLIVTGFITCLLLALNLLGLIDTTSSTYIILNNLAQVPLYFTPIFVAYTSAKKFNTEPVLAMVLAASLVYPDWVTLAAQGGYTSYFGIPTLLTTYNGAVIQVIITVFVMSKIDVVLKKYLPDTIKHFLKPFILTVVTSVIMFTVTAPLGGLFTNYIAAGADVIRTHVPWLVVPAIILFASTIGMVAPGFHLSLIPIALTSIATVGYDDFINIWFYCCTITPGFIALAVALKTKNKTLKQIAFPASVSALFGGISEPTTYGISYKMPKIWLCYFITAMTTAFYAGIVGLKCYGFGGYSLTNILLYLGTNMDTANFIKALIGVGIMAVMSFVTVFIAKWDDSVYNDNEESM